MTALEKAVERAANAALDKAAAEAVERIQKAMVPPELATLRQRIGELDRLRSGITTEIAEVRATTLRYAIWAGAGFFAVMVLASIVGGAIVAALFRPSRRA
jgi:Ni,Fe-hydrogenase III large subunit